MYTVYIDYRKIVIMQLRPGFVVSKTCLKK